MAVEKVVICFLEMKDLDEQVLRLHVIETVIAVGSLFYCIISLHYALTIIHSLKRMLSVLVCCCCFFFQRKKELDIAVLLVLSVLWVGLLGEHVCKT